MARRGKTFHFLLIFDHDAGVLVEETMFTDGPRATAAYSAAELDHAGDENLEIVLVGADSIETIHRTHAAYFTGEAKTEMGSVDDVMRQLIAHLSADDLVKY